MPQPERPHPPLLVVMGVAGSGKTTVGRLVALALDVPFLDADDHHSAANVATMRSGVALDDAARRPWVARLHEELVARADGDGAVLACSALRESFRDELGRGLPQLRYVLLRVPDAELQRRLERRRGHFVGPELLPSQLATLEIGGALVSVDGDRPPDEVAAEIVALVRR